MINKEAILALIKAKKVLKSANIADSFGVTRQYASKVLSELVAEEKIIKMGSTRAAMYVYPEYDDIRSIGQKGRYVKSLDNKDLEEHKVLDNLERTYLPFKKLSENIKSIFTYAFSEMLNNAIDHSRSKVINISVTLTKDNLTFMIDDYGVGVYRNIMHKRKLSSEIEAIQDLLKGKITTAPSLHSGEGIFFTSKVGDLFVLNSFGYEFKADNKIKDIFISRAKGNTKKGTRVTFTINIKDKHHLNDIFKKYTDQSEEGEGGFDKTEIRVRLYIMGGIHISRSQARRVLSGLEKFKVVVMDYDRVPMVGQAFADEVYRVFKNKHSDIEIDNINMNEAVDFMVTRAKIEAERWAS